MKIANKVGRPKGSRSRTKVQVELDSIVSDRELDRIREVKDTVHQYFKKISNDDLCRLKFNARLVNTISILSTQASSPILDRYIRGKLSRFMTDVEDFSLKCTMRTRSNYNINAVQIRPHENVNLIIAAIDTISNEHRMYRIPSNEVKKVIDSYGTSAHLSESVARNNKFREYSIHVPFFDPMMDVYRDKSLESIIFNNF